MDLQSFINAALPWLYGLLALAGVFALIQLGRLFATTRKQVDELGDKTQPILEKADVSVDALNAELLRVDGILGDVERITEAAANTTQSVEKVTSAPLEIATTLADKLRNGFNSFVGSVSAQPSEGKHSTTGAEKDKPKSESYVTSEGGATPAASDILTHVPSVVPDAKATQPSTTSTEVPAASSAVPPVDAKN